MDVSTVALSLGEALENHGGDLGGKHGHYGSCVESSLWGGGRGRAGGPGEVKVELVGLAHGLDVEQRKPRAQGDSRVVSLDS